MDYYKMYGIVKPRSLDYFLSFVFALASVSALWTAIWISATGTNPLSHQAISLALRALGGIFGGQQSAFVSVMGIFFYVGMLASLVFMIFFLLGKNYRGLIGILSMALSVGVLTFQMAFFATFLTAISGIYVAFLAFFMLCGVIILCLTARLVFCTAVAITRPYMEYLMDFPKKEQEHCCEEQEKFVPETETFMDKIEQEPAHEDEVEESVAEEDEEHSFNDLNMKRLSFDEKLRKAHKETRKKFKEIDEYFISLGFKSTRTKSAQTYVYKNVKYAQITTMGKNGLKIFYKLHSKDYEGTPIPVEDVSAVKKYDSLPMMFRVKSDLSVRRAKKLMDDVKKSLE